VPTLHTVLHKQTKPKTKPFIILASTFTQVELCVAMVLWRGDGHCKLVTRFFVIRHKQTYIMYSWVVLFYNLLLIFSLDKLFFSYCCIFFWHKGLSRKDVCSQGGWGLSSADILQTRGSSDADVRTFWCKNLKFFEIYGVSAQTRGVKPVRTRGRRVNFLRYCGDFFYGRPLNNNTDKVKESDKETDWLYSLDLD